LTPTDTISSSESDSGSDAGSANAPLPETLPETLPDTLPEIDKRGHKGPERRCLASGDTRDMRAMVRFVRAPDGAVTPDIAAKLPGRGVWVSADRQSLETVIKRKDFARGFKAKVVIGDDLVGLVDNLLARRVLGLLTMANKAGDLCIGFDQVKTAAQSGPLAFRIEASDGSEDGRGKIRVLTKAISREMGLRITPVIGCFDARQLGQAVGRDNLVHAALRTGGFSKSLGPEIGRLSGFRDMIPERWPDRAHEVRDFSQKPL